MYCHLILWKYLTSWITSWYDVITTWNEASSVCRHFESQNLRSTRRSWVLPQYGTT
ncbi:hypothetical protein DPMN_094424 [Dreissena polymorpha]|uniref:Uncharacterized protein n=1 Tax=Dreissena polymorpha TaxID=45954 RepID=A0A9D4L7E5_DREPO|nr:hypothetical protein DPMN_094424 [Dreissena polymorpha]